MNTTEPEAHLELLAKLRSRKWTTDYEQGVYELKLLYIEVAALQQAGRDAIATMEQDQQSIRDLLAGLEAERILHAQTRAVVEDLNTLCTAERERVRVLEEALGIIIKLQPCTLNGGCFYPMHDGEGEYIGEQNVDPITVIQEMAMLAHTTPANPPAANDAKEGSK